MARILFFGITRDITGKSELYNSSSDLQDLLKDLIRQYPQLEKVRFRIAVNNVLGSGITLLGDDDTVALLPPFAGG